MFAGSEESCTFASVFHGIRFKVNKRLGQGVDPFFMLSFCNKFSPSKPSYTVCLRHLSACGHPFTLHMQNVSGMLVRSMFLLILLWVVLNIGLTNMISLAKIIHLARSSKFFFRFVSVDVNKGEIIATLLTELWYFLPIREIATG